MPQDPVVTAVLAAALGALIGVAGTAFGRWVLRKKTAAASWEALNAEIQMCHDMAVGYETEVRARAIALPLSRWPTTFYADMMKTVIAEREIRPEEIKPMMAFYNVVDQVNLAFDQALHARDRWLAHRPDPGRKVTGWATRITHRSRPATPPTPAVLALREIGRLWLKVSHLVGNGDANDVYTPANRIATDHCCRFNSLCWRLLFLRLRG